MIHMILMFYFWVQFRHFVAKLLLSPTLPNLAKNLYDYFLSYTVFEDVYPIKYENKSQYL